jgi:predicted glycosyltransferase
MYVVSNQVAPTLDTELRSLAQGFRARAEEILLRAETMHDLDICLKLREIAANYEGLARRVEQRVPPQD